MGASRTMPCSHEPILRLGSSNNRAFAPRHPYSFTFIKGMEEHTTRDSANFPIDYFIFSGGGIRGLAFVGALDVLHRLYRSLGRDLLRDIKGAAGTSIGALVALLCVCGHEPAEMVRHLTCNGLTDIISNMEVMRFHENYGLINGNFLQEWVSRILDQRFGSADITMADLFLRTGKTLKVVTTDLAHNKRLVFDPVSSPHMLVRVAIAGSMTVPLLFPPVLIADHMIVDGGVYDNFPIDVFPRRGTMAFSLYTDLTHQVSHVGDYIMNLFDSIFVRREREQHAAMSDEQKVHVVVIPVDEVNTFNFGISPERRRSVIKKGQNSMLGMLLTWCMMYSGTGRDDAVPKQQPGTGVQMDPSSAQDNQ